MLLKEFQINISENDKAKRIKFMLESQHITTLYEKLLERVETNDIWKLLVICKKAEIRKNGINLLGVLEIEIKFDIDNYFKKGEYQKQLLIFDALKRGVCKAISIMQWDPIPFNIALKKSEEIKFKNIWFYKKRLYNPTKMFIAQVFWEHNMYSIDLYLQILDRKKNLVAKVKVVSEIPREPLILSYLGEIKWVSDSKVLLHTKDDSNYYELEVPT